MPCTNYYVNAVLKVLYVINQGMEMYSIYGIYKMYIYAHENLRIKFGILCARCALLTISV